MPTIHYISNSLLKSKGIATPKNILPPTEFSFSSLFDTADLAEVSTDEEATVHEKKHPPTKKSKVYTELEYATKKS